MSGTTEFDVIIVGAGMGGSPVGWTLAQAGLKVLFLERGLPKAQWNPDYAGDYPEYHLNDQNRKEVLERSGRAIYECDSWIPVMGGGEGGGSAVYGSALFRFHPEDLKDWSDFSYENLTPYYQKCEELFCVRGTQDPLSQDQRNLKQPRQLSPYSQDLFQSLQKLGLHPFQSPIGYENLPGCKECFGFYCPTNCKKTASNVFLDPALKTGLAKIQYSTVVEKLILDGNKISKLQCRTANGFQEYKAKWFFLAAGALITPTLLLNSLSEKAPNGIGNQHDLVGRHLMRHLIDFYYLKTPSSFQAHGHLIEISLTDFYHNNGYQWGILNTSAGLMSAQIMASEFVERIHKLSPIRFPKTALKKIVHVWLNRQARERLLLNTIIQDSACFENRVLPGSKVDSIQTFYRICDKDKIRVQESRQHLKKLFKPFSVNLLKVAEDSSFLAHACGTTRMADDPTQGVVDFQGRVFGVNNLFISDTSIFRNSGGVNPSLTIAACALKLAERFRDDVIQRPTNAK